jgi:Fur family transcriptional regulator, stress-responsive regulator
VNTEPGRHLLPGPASALGSPAPDGSAPPGPVPEGSVRGPAPGSASDPAELLRLAGLRVTAPRLAILQVVTDRPHIDTDAVRRAVRERLGTVSTQAVYDVLGTLTSVGLLRRIEPAGSPARYERRTSHQHHHLVCRTCGAMRDGLCAVGDENCLHPSDSHGFTVEETEVIWWGTCPGCLEAARSRHPSETSPDAPFGRRSRSRRTGRRENHSHGKE